MRAGALAIIGIGASVIGFLLADDARAGVSVRRPAAIVVTHFVGSSDRQAALPWLHRDRQRTGMGPRTD